MIMSQQRNLSFKIGLMDLMIKVTHKLIIRTVENFGVACRFRQLTMSAL